jgi:hypothetical protein
MKKGNSLTSSSAKFDLEALEISLILDNFNEWLIEQKESIQSLQQGIQNTHHFIEFIDSIKFFLWFVVRVKFSIFRIFEAYR